MSDILFVCDAGPEVGGGHVMRSLTLAGALAAEGLRPVFLATPAVADVLDAFDALDCGRVPAPEPKNPADLSAAAAAALDERRFAAVVADHFGMAAAEEAPLRAPDRPLLVLDDLADRPHAADLLLDPGLGRRAEDYAGLLPPEAALLLGPHFALVRPQFRAARERSPRPNGPAPVRRVLVSLGLTDLGGITARVAELIAPLLGNAACDLVTGVQAPSLGSLEQRAAGDPRFTLHVNSTQVAELMAAADVAVGAGGSSTWERACLGLPTLTLVLADNQVPGASRLAEAGLTLVVDARGDGFEAAFADAFRRLLDDAELRQRMSAGTAALCDGRGAQRAARRLRERLGSPTGR